MRHACPAACLVFLYNSKTSEQGHITCLLVRLLQLLNLLLGFELAAGGLPLQLLSCRCATVLFSAATGH